MLKRRTFHNILKTSCLAGENRWLGEDGLIVGMPDHFNHVHIDFSDDVNIPTEEPLGAELKVEYERTINGEETWINVYKTNGEYKVPINTKVRVSSSSDPEGAEYQWNLGNGKAVSKQEENFITEVFTEEKDYYIDGVILKKDPTGVYACGQVAWGEKLVVSSQFKPKISIEMPETIYTGESATFSVPETINDLTGARIVHYNWTVYTDVSSGDSWGFEEVSYPLVGSSLSHSFTFYGYHDYWVQVEAIDENGQVGTARVDVRTKSNYDFALISAVNTGCDYTDANFDVVVSGDRLETQLIGERISEYDGSILAGDIINISADPTLPIGMMTGSGGVVKWGAAAIRFSIRRSDGTLLELGRVNISEECRQAGN